MAPNNEGHHYDSQTYAGDRATEVQRAMRNMPDEDRSSRSELQANIAGSQSAQLAPQVRMGDDRAIGSPPNWEAMSSTELHTAATQNNSPVTADNLGRAFNEGGNRLAEAANRLLAAVDKLDAAWRGAAADAARGALTPLAEVAGQAVLAAQMMGAQMAKQTAAASEVRTLPPPEEFDYQSELSKALANPNPVAGLADMKAKKDRADAVKREQVSYLNSYTQTMAAVDSQTPSFVEPTTSISSGEGGRAHITGGAVNYPGTRDGNQRTAPGAPVGRSGAAPGFAPGGPPSDGTDGQEIGPLPSINTGIGTGTSGYAPTTTPALPGGSPAGGVHTGAPGAGSGGFGSGFGSFGGAPGAPGQARPGAGPGAAPGSATAGGPGRGLGTGGGPGTGGPVAGPGPAAGRGAAARGATGMGAGAGARKEEDEEHERPSYLIEADPDGAFGTDEATAPPVIGQE